MILKKNFLIKFFTIMVSVKLYANYCHIYFIKFPFMKNKFLLFSGLLALLIFIACNNQSSQKAIATTDADSTSVTGNWKLGVQLWTFRLFSQADALAKTDSAGVKYIEAFLGQPLDNASKDTFGIRMSDTCLL